MEFFWGALALALVVIWVLTIADIIKRRLGPSRTAAWLLIVLLLPFAGSILYYALRRPSDEEIQRSLDSRNALRGHPR